LHRQLKARAALAGMALSDFLIREVRKIAEYPTPEEMRERLAQRDPLLCHHPCSVSRTWSFTTCGTRQRADCSDAGAPGC